MKHQQALIEKYCSKGYYYYSRTYSEVEWDNQEKAYEFMSKYWLSSEKELEAVSMRIEEMFNNSSSTFPELQFNNDYNLIFLPGACLLTKEDFVLLQTIMSVFGDEHFYIIQNQSMLENGEPSFRMKFPSNITWAELMSGNCISSALFELIHNDYFVIGQSNKWGKYSATDYIWPMDVYGIRANEPVDIAHLFDVERINREDVYGWLPNDFKKEFLENLYNKM